MTSKELMNLDAQCVMQTYGRFPVAIDHGEGATLYSPEGKKYIDFTSGIGVNCLGYGNKKWRKAITDQAAKLGHISNLFYSEPYIELAHQLIARTGMKRAFFANGGGEANEGMIKLCRKYSYDRYGAGRSTIITLKDSFHGRTITTLTATGQDVFHQYFFPFTEGFQYAAPNDLEAIKALDDGTVCAVMVELIQGEGGVLPLNQDYVNALQALCQEKDWLLAVDEVQTGVGRTGSLFCFQDYGILPDVVSFAKGIGGGEIHSVTAQLEHSRFKGCSGSGGVFGEDHRQGFTGQTVMTNAVAYIVFQLICQIENFKDVLGGEIQKLQ